MEVDGNQKVAAASDGGLQSVNSSGGGDLEEVPTHGNVDNPTASTRGGSPKMSNGEIGGTESGLVAGNRNDCSPSSGGKGVSLDWDAAERAGLWWMPLSW